MKKLFISVNAVLLFFAGMSLAEVDFTPFQSLLNKHLKLCEDGETGFDYDAAQKKSMADVDKQGQILAIVDPSKFSSNEEALAFWINTYNFTMMRTVLTRYKKNLKGPRSLFFVFKRKFFTVAGQSRSLDDIEHGIVRPLAKRMFQGSRNGLYASRVHFALNCASMSCPPLQKEIFKTAKLNVQLDRATREALKNKDHLLVQVSPEESVISLSEIFKWFPEDFRHDSGTLKNWLLYWAPENKRDEIETVTDDGEFEYHPYNWKLNRTREGCVVFPG